MSLLSVVTIDDESYVHDGLDSIMDWERIGYAHVGSALNGVEGLSLISSLRPDVILTDIRMPAMSGLELIARVRRMRHYSPSFIVISGYDEFEYARTALRHQVDDYLLKPIDEQQLEEQLVRIRSRVEAQAEPAGTAQSDAGKGAARESASVLNTAIRRMLSGERAEEIVRLADRRLRGGDTSALLLAVFVPVDTSLSALRQPLAATEIRYALASSKARESLDWVVSEPYGGVAALLTTSEHDGELDLWVRGLYRSVAAGVSRPLLLAVSSMFRDVRGISGARQELQRLFASGHLVDDVGYVISGRHDERANGARFDGPARDAVSGPSGRVAPPDLEATIDAVERLDTKRAVATLRDALEQLAKQRPPSNLLRDFVTEIRAQGDRLVFDLGGSASNQAAHEEMRYVARNAEYVPLVVIAEVSFRFVRMLIDSVATLRQTQRHTAVALMKRRADRRFAEDISIAEFADEYDMNAVYLGQLFRRQLGVGFKDYLRSRRIREACRLLRDTDSLVPEIAHIVGYRDVDYFTDQFKREIDVTPTAYRAGGESES